MRFYRGRLLDHVHLVVSDVEVSRRFYLAAINSLGLAIDIVDGPGFFFADELFVSKGTQISKVHIAFQATSREIVSQFHKAALQAGGTDNGPPGERIYHPGYYAAYVLDPDGNNIEAVFHGPAARTADAIVISPV